jgi:hypothetical protein
LGAYTPTRGHSPEAIDAAVTRLRSRGWIDGEDLSPVGAAARQDIEAATDMSQAELMDALDGRLEWVTSAASALSIRVVAAGAFKGDELKRAAG